MVSCVPFCAFLVGVTMVLGRSCDELLHGKTGNENFELGVPTPFASIVGTHDAGSHMLYDQLVQGWGNSKLLEPEKGKELLNKFSCDAVAYNGALDSELGLSGTHGMRRRGLGAASRGECLHACTVSEFLRVFGQSKPRPDVKVSIDISSASFAMRERPRLIRQLGTPRAMYLYRNSVLRTLMHIGNNNKLAREVGGTLRGLARRKAEFLSLLIAAFKNPVLVDGEAVQLSPESRKVLEFADEFVHITKGPMCVDPKWPLGDTSLHGGAWIVSTSMYVTSLLRWVTHIPHGGLMAMEYFHTVDRPTESYAALAHHFCLADSVEEAIPTAKSLSFPPKDSSDYPSDALVADISTFFAEFDILHQILLRHLYDQNIINYIPPAESPIQRWNRFAIPLPSSAFQKNPNPNLQGKKQKVVCKGQDTFQAMQSAATQGKLSFSCSLEVA